MPLQYIVMLVVALIVTPPFVLLIPHARQSPAFDRLLWAGTFALTFLGGWIALNNLGPLAPDVAVGGVPLVPIVMGAVVSGIALNVILWLLDQFERPEEGELDEDELEPVEPDGDEPEEIPQEDDKPDDPNTPQ